MQAFPFTKTYNSSMLGTIWPQATWDHCCKRRTSKKRMAPAPPCFFSNFLVYLTTAYRQGGSFTQLIQAIHAAKPASVSKPWKLILYADEIIPGNVLGRAERKLWAVYSTFDEFQGHLHHEDLWCTIALERSKFVATLDAGVAQMMTKVLNPSFATHG